jgi:hypothetical protein
LVAVAWQVEATLAVTLTLSGVVVPAFAAPSDRHDAAASAPTPRTLARR